MSKLLLLDITDEVADHTAQRCTRQEDHQEGHAKNQLSFGSCLLGICSPLLPPQPPVPEPEPASAAAPSRDLKEGNRNVAKTIAVKFVILQQFKELAAAGKNANIEMLKLKVKEYYAGVPPVHDLDDCLASFSSIASGRLESHDVGCHG